MARAVFVSLAYNPRPLRFDPGELDIADQDAVVVKTKRGLEFGRARGSSFELDEAIAKSLAPMKPVVRLATEEDVAAAAEMEQRGREALPVFKEMAAGYDSDIHPVAVEFLLDGDKAVFYFEAEKRVDFRELVRKLAARFHVRIDMRQIGVRDEARLVGGLGHCGQELCCKRMGAEFCPVSIRMAKEQDLSLNPQSISGVCGRLMCCLRYEYEAYKDFKKRAPKLGAKVSTPEGEAKVAELDVLHERVKVSRDGDKPLSVPIEAFEEPEEGKRPSAVSEKGWQEALAEQAQESHGDAIMFVTQFTGNDKLAEAGTVRRTPGGRGRSEKPSQRDEGASARKPRSRRRSSKQGGGGAADQQSSSRKQRRRSTTISAEGRKQPSGASAKGSKPASRKQGAPKGGSKGSGPRPGQKSSGLRGGQGANGAKGSPGKPQGQRRRRRSHKGGGQGESAPSQGQGGSQAQGRDAR